MLKICILLLSFMSSVIFSQSHRFIYSYKFVPDSTKTEIFFKEETRLDIFKDHSEFLSNNTAKRDSAIARTITNNQSQSSVTIPEGLYKNKIYKDKNYIYSIEFVGIQPFKVAQYPILNWKILKETRSIQNYKCQKATVSYGGRNWEAWFTQEIPFQDGPYIFTNLPGLIVSVTDSKKQHSFLLEENYKVDNAKTNFVYKRYFVPIEINEEKFNKKWNEFVKNPLGQTEQFMIMNPGLLSGKSFDINGNEIDQTQKKREEKKDVIRHLSENNNFINLNLYRVR
jgi:GLPGLI family protein